MITYEINEHNQPIVNGKVVELTQFPHFNGENWFEFESEEERQAFIQANTIPAMWDKQSYCDALNDAHNALFRRMYQERNYLTIGEIPIWETDADFGAESVALQEWWRETCKTVATYTQNVTEQTALPIEEFLNSLPQINTNG